MESVGRGPDEQLNEGEQIQMTRRVEGLERGFEIEPLNRNAEREVAQPESAPDEILLVSEEAAEGHGRVIGQREQAGDRDDAQRDGHDEQPRHETAFVGLQVPRRQEDERHDTDREPDRQRGQRVHDANRRTGRRCLPQHLLIHASASANTRSYSSAIACAL